ncbi:hypothetical protein AURANDRAFT_61863 [Aureococcus anophagefferens]|uniref:Uncharacterized protein n=1 Tax=Aureococcus anophagefferens TaxID=44056 RepID=F0XZX6_AURAN|nr:hypothetical protein AURANDRAFT_61863 [Aureococcus anophagefferens]EGB11419.1 hypothetical protein AURANDRAFT_61863 [Aureococcus anophagefferens]|eukprot:XP_009033789.1 hypothetical protein AURANDRAFT_61863 [Aureococcus anophagefferens]
MGLGLEALGISADDMTPAEAAELSRLLKQVKQLEAAAAEKDSGGRPGSRNGARARQQKGGGAIPALITSASAKEAAAASPSRARSPAKATTRPAYPSVRIGQSARAYAERQRLARAGEAQRAEHGDGDDFGGKRAAPPEPPKRPDVVTRVVLWPEYATLADGDVAVHVERHYRPAPAGRGRPAQPRWKVLAASERARRRLDLRLDALRKCGPRDLLGRVRVHVRGERGPDAAPAVRSAKLRLLSDTVVVEEPRYPPAPPPRRKRHGGGGRGRGGGPAPADDGDADGRDGQSNLEIAGFSVQVAAHARGALYMDTLHSTVAKRSIEKTAPHVAQRPLGTSDLVEGLMGWLTHLGMPVDACGAEQLSEYEADALASYKRVEEAEVGHLVALLIGTAANDVTFGALVSALKVAAAAAAANAADAADGGDSLASDDLDRENIAGFGASAYRDLKRHVVQAAHARGARAFAQHKPLEQQTIMRIATLVDDHGIDLQEVFLDTPVRVGVVRGDVRISFAELRRGLWRLLSCLPPA